METLAIGDVTDDNVAEWIELCIPPDKRDNPFFVEGRRTKGRWASQVMQNYGSVAKLAHIESRAVGMIQYLPRVEERLVEINCIFVPDKEHLRKGVGRALVQALIADMNRPKPYFAGDTATALVTQAFEVPGFYPQHEFYARMGFRRTEPDNPFLLHYPLRAGYVYVPKRGPFVPQEEDKGKALIFYEPSCPFSVYFTHIMEEFIQEVAPDVEICVVNKFEEAEEVKKRGAVPECVVNQKPIASFFLDKESFQREVQAALR